MMQLLDLIDSRFHKKNFIQNDEMKPIHFISLINISMGHKMRNHVAYLMPVLSSKQDQKRLMKKKKKTFKMFTEHALFG